MNIRISQKNDWLIFGVTLPEKHVQTICGCLDLADPRDHFSLLFGAAYTPCAGTCNIIFRSHRCVGITTEIRAR